MAFRTKNIRRQFPIFEHKRDLVYLDSAATAQKPAVVLDAMRTFEESSYANPHRGMHMLAEEATNAFENARTIVQRFINAKHVEEIVFTKNATEAINLVAKSFGATLNKGDAVLLSPLEHHSNVIPWMQLAQDRGIDVRWMDMDGEGNPKLPSMNGVKVVSITAQSNVLGVRPDIKEMTTIAHDAGAKVLVDAAQFVAHAETDVADLDCDFLAFSGHKLYGPTGIGVLYGKRELLGAMPPFLGGGMMIREVRDDGFTAADLPQKFEAGTQPVTQAIGLAAAIDWLSQFNWKDIDTHESEVIAYAFDRLKKIDGLKILGPSDPSNIHGCLSFVIDGVHPHDLTDIIGKKGVCLRAGHHCAQPLHAKLGINASTRLSVGIYNTKDDVDAAVAAIKEAISILKN